MSVIRQGVRVAFRMFDDHLVFGTGMETAAISFWLAERLWGELKDSLGYAFVVDEQISELEETGE